MSNQQNHNKANSWLDRLAQVLSLNPKDETQLLDIIRDARDRQLLDANAFTMIEGVLEVQELRVNEVMIPRSHMVTIENNLTFDQIVDKVVKSGHSRFPVVGDSKDGVLGILLAKDLLAYTCNNQKFILRDMLRPTIFVPESKRLDVLLQDFRINRNHMAIVVDEYGGITGLVTIEDVLEQIVGDIKDEFDINEGTFIKKQLDNSYSVNALTPIDDFNEFFGSMLDDKGVETIGGLVVRGLGHLPKRGETVEIGDFVFKIIRADSRRIYLLQAIPKIKQEECSH